MKLLRPQVSRLHCSLSLLSGAVPIICHVVFHSARIASKWRGAILQKSNGGPPEVAREVCFPPDTMRKHGSRLASALHPKQFIDDHQDVVGPEEVAFRAATELKCVSSEKPENAPRPRLGRAWEGTMRLARSGH